MLAGVPGERLLYASRMDSPLRIGLLGAARIAPFALLSPARQVPQVQVAAIAARDSERAGAFAKKHGVPRVLGSYAALIDDPAIDAIYNPLPNALHAEWTLRALAAGKHVLCEKPFTANAAEAERVAEAAAGAGRVCMEAFHYRYHPLAEHIVALVRSGELGAVRRIETFINPDHDPTGAGYQVIQSRIAILALLTATEPD